VATRVSVCDTSIIGYEVPKGTRIILAPWAINRSSELWGPDANTFNPSRWIDSNTGKANNTGGATSNYSLLTFLHGPRNCIGQGFAKAELRTLVTAFILAFEVELIHQHHVIMPGGSLSAKPSGGMRLKLRQMATLY
jgi:cytochrome P450